MLIASSNDRERAKAVIERLKPILEDRLRYRAALAEFGAWLDMVEIDLDLISRAIRTDLKDDLIEFNSGCRGIVCSGSDRDRRMGDFALPADR
jgi:hypothetical protein